MSTFVQRQVASGKKKDTNRSIINQYCFFPHKPNLFLSWKAGLKSQHFKCRSIGSNGLIGIMWLIEQLIESFFNSWPAWINDVTWRGQKQTCLSGCTSLPLSPSKSFNRHLNFKFSVLRHFTGDFCRVRNTSGHFSSSRFTSQSQLHRNHKPSHASPLLCAYWW